MKVYLVCETVDLGYHVVEAYFNEDTATTAATNLNIKHNAKKINELIKNCNYSYTSASKWVENRPDQYFVESVKVT